MADLKIMPVLPIRLARVIGMLLQIGFGHGRRHMEACELQFQLFQHPGKLGDGEMMVLDVK